MLCISCEDDPKLVEKQAQQNLEITRMNGEIVLLEEKIKNLPPDVSKELVQTEQQVKEQAAEVAKLEAEITELESRKRSMQSEFDSYRAKYQLK